MKSLGISNTPPPWSAPKMYSPRAHQLGLFFQQYLLYLLIGEQTGRSSPFPRAGVLSIHVGGAWANLSSAPRCCGHVWAGGRGSRVSGGNNFFPTVIAGQAKNAQLQRISSGILYFTQALLYLCIRQAVPRSLVSSSHAITRIP